MGNYSWGAYSTLPTDDADLSNILDAAALSQIASDDTVRLAQPADGMISIIQFKDTITAGSATVRWNGQSNVAPSSAAVNLEIYNRSGTPAWESLTSDNTTAVDTDLTLSSYISDLTDYKNVNDIACRVYQAASSGPPVTKIFSDNTTGTYPADSGCTGTAVTTIYGNSATHDFNYGGATPLPLVYVNLNSNAQLLLKFTALTSVIPSNAVIDSCILGLYADAGGGGMTPATYKIFRLKRDWVEGTGDGTAYQAGSASADQWGGGNSWQNPFSEGVTLAASGNDDRDNSVGDYGQITSPDPYPPAWFTSTDSHLVAHIQNWVNGTNPNYGWVIGEYVSGDASGLWLPIIAHGGTNGFKPYLSVTWHT